MDVLYEHEAWALAWHYLGPFTWCKDKKAPSQLNRWLLNLLDDNVLTEKTVVKIRNYAQAKLVSLCRQGCFCLTVFMRDLSGGVPACLPVGNFVKGYLCL